MHTDFRPASTRSRVPARDFRKAGVRARFRWGPWAVTGAPTTAPTTDAARVDAKAMRRGTSTGPMPWRDVVDAGPALATFHGVAVRAGTGRCPRSTRSGGTRSTYGGRVDCGRGRPSAGTARAVRRDARALILTPRPHGRGGGRRGRSTAGGDPDATRVWWCRSGGRWPEGEAFRVTVWYHGALFQGTGADATNLATLGGLMAFQRNRAGRKILRVAQLALEGAALAAGARPPRDGAMVAMTATFPARYTVRSPTGARGDARRGGRRAGVVVLLRDADARLRRPRDRLRRPGGVDRDNQGQRRSPVGCRTRGWMRGDALRGSPAAMDYYEATFGPFRWEQAGFGRGADLAGHGARDARHHGREPFQPPRATARSPSTSSPTTGAATRPHRHVERLPISEGFTDYLTGRFVRGPRRRRRPGSATGTSTPWRSVSKAGYHRHPLRPRRPGATRCASSTRSPTRRARVSKLRTLEHRVGTEAFTTFPPRVVRPARGRGEDHAGLPKPTSPRPFPRPASRTSSGSSCTASLAPVLDAKSATTPPAQRVTRSRSARRRPSPRRRLHLARDRGVRPRDMRRARP